MRRLIHIFRHERGSAFLFTTASLVFILAMGGFAIDFAYQVTVKNELQRAMDAAALAAAGKLNFDATGITAARSNAQNFASLNPYRVGPVSLSANTNNDPAGHIVVGLWDPNNRTFTPAPDPPNPTQVNSVLTQFQTTIPTSFLRLLGINTLPVQAQAIAWAPPPATPPTTNTPTCIFPIGVIEAPCGSAVQMISSSDSSSVGGNTAGWVNLQGCDTANPQPTATAINQSANGGCPQSNLRTGMYLGTNNGQMGPPWTAIEGVFPSNFYNSDTVTIKDTNENIVYSGQAWAVTVPVVSPTGTSSPPPEQCPGTTTTWAPSFMNRVACAVSTPWTWLIPGPAFAQGRPVNQAHQITGWSKFYIVQVVSKPQGEQKQCLVNNPNYTGINCASLPTNITNAIYGYLNCEKSTAEGQTPPDVGPSVAFANTLKLVR